MIICDYSNSLPSVIMVINASSLHAPLHSPLAIKLEPECSDDTGHGKENASTFSASLNVPVLIIPSQPKATFMPQIAFHA